MNGRKLLGLIRAALRDHVTTPDQSGTTKQRHATKRGPGRMHVGSARCWCGAPIINGHHCSNGHLQNRGLSAAVPS